MSRKRIFDLGTVLTVTTNIFLTDCDRLYEILDWMTGDELFTHQLPRAARECAPYILKQYPALNEVKPPERCADWKKWLAEQRKKYGDEFSIKPLPKGVHEFKDPITELREMRPDMPIVPIIVGTPPPGGVAAAKGE